MEYALIALGVLAGMMLVTVLMATLFCQLRMGRKKRVSYWSIFFAASVAPLLLAGVATLFQPDIWWSRENKNSPIGFVIALIFLALLCALPAFGVVVRYKRREERNDAHVV